MGLALQVGLLADLVENDPEGAEFLSRDLEQLNAALLEQGLPSHSEPRDLAPFTDRSKIIGYPYSFLHRLRRVYAHVIREPGWEATPAAEDYSAEADTLVADESLEFRSHLLVHSDCDGFYVPIDFEEPIFADDKMRGGGIIGSSQRLFNELVLIAPSLGIRLESDHSLSDAEAQRISELIEAEVPLSVELIVWFTFYEAARLSIELKSVICFC